MMPQEGIELCWMRNKDFYLGVLDEIITRMTQMDMTLDELSQGSGLEPKRLNHILSGMIEDLTLLELDNILAAVNAAPTSFAFS
jgi:Cro/C1-type HTH DNA-binding domain